MADQLDRDYELMTHNYHPGQSHLHEVRNKYLRDEAREEESRAKGEQTELSVFEQ